MKEVFLHIGLHKTGSTSIQRALVGFNENGIKSIDFKEENHSIPMYTIFSESRYDYHIWKNKQYSKERIDRKKNSYLKILAKELNNPKTNTLIISGEDLSALNNSEVKVLSEFLNQYRVKTTVICYVRDPLSWIMSNTQERVKAGLKIVKIDCIFKNILESYAEYFGKEHIRVFDFQDSITSHESITKHFSKELSINLIEPPRLNESLNAVQFSLLQILNTLDTSNTRFDSRGKIFNLILKVGASPNLGNDAKLDKRYFAELITQNNKDECEWLLNEYGIKYELTLTEDDKSLDYYLNKTLKNSLKIIEELFYEIGIPYNHNIGLRDNFLNAYTFF